MTIQEKLYRKPIGKYVLFILNRGNLTCRAPVQTRCTKVFSQLPSVTIALGKHADTVTASNTQEERRDFS
jgi:hypothetical protein